MKVLILGATGGTGLELVKQALAAGHDVTAFVRDPIKLKIVDERLKVVQGNILDVESLERAIPGHDAVISALGSPGLGPSTELSDGTRNIIDVMERSNVKRLIFETTVGVGDSREHLSWFARLFFFPLVIKNIVADKEIQERLIKESSLNWTIVRPGRLTNGPRVGRYREGEQINADAHSRSISRADVAEFMLRQLIDDRYHHKTPAVSY